MDDVSFHLVCFHLNTEDEGFIAVGSLCPENFKLKISCRYSADYVKEMCLNVCSMCTCILIIFPHATNHISGIDL